MTTTTQHLGSHGLLIGDRRVLDTSAGIHGHVFPGTGKVNASVTLAGPTDVDAAVLSAGAAQNAWWGMPVDTRRDLLLRLSDLVEAEAEEVARLSVADNGSPMFISGIHPTQLVRWLRYYAGWVDKDGGQMPPTSFTSDLNLITHEPYGVVAVILPWNGPLYGIAMGVVPALAAGNAVIIKPPELAPLTSLRFGELALEAGLPSGLVNVLPADPDGSEVLVRHRGIGKIHFTGSGAVAKKIHVAAAENLTPVATELGGKSANIIFDDADLDQAAMLSAFSGPLAQSGQNCACGSRILVQSGVHDEFLEKMLNVMRFAEAGDPFDDDTMVGPVISEAAVARILSVIERARVAGSNVAIGGERLGGELADGFYLAPTLLTNVDPSSEVFQNETFGPVVSVVPFDTAEEAVDLANRTDYGLVSYVHTKDLARTHQVARALESGSIFVNTFPDLIPTAPYGGYKQSGHGRLGGLEGLREFQQVKNVRIALGKAELPS